MTTKKSKAGTGTKQGAAPQGAAQTQGESRAPDEQLHAQKAFEEFKAVARAIDARDVGPLRGDPQLALVNVQRGVAAVLDRKAKLSGKITSEELAEIESLPSLALAVTFATSQVNRTLSRSDGSIAEKLAQARKIRRVLLLAAEACAAAELVPENEVSIIRKGKGQIDTAQDCVSLAAFYAKHAAALANNTPATPKMLADASAVGTDLLMLLKPGTASANDRTPQPVAEAADLRDRLWTLLTTHHETLWKAGAILFGKRVDEHVPPLQSHEGTPKKTQAPGSKAEGSSSGT